MSITIQWDDINRQELLFLRFDTDWNWGEFRQVVLETITLIQAHNHPVDVIMDLHDCQPFQEFDGMTHVWWLMRQWRDIWHGYIVVISHDPVIRVVASLIRQQDTGLRWAVLVANDEADARAILRHRRA